jgi:prepilin-type N-terminal cleavage/methylation domain-containing protein
MKTLKNDGCQVAGGRLTDGRCGHRSGHRSRCLPRASTFNPQPSAPNPFRAFTLIELLVVMAVIGVLASLLLAVVGGVKKKQYVYNTQAEMAKLETAIERYKAAYGVYPQSPTIPPKVGDSTTLVNALYYELVGTIYTNGSYVTLDGGATIPAVDVPVAFPGIGGFINCTKPGSGEDTASARSFISDLSVRQIAAISNNARPVAIFIGSVGGPDQTYRPLNAPDVNPWRYNSSSPTNNPGSYDLWIQLVIGGKTNLICNWSKQVQINSPLP